MILYRVYLTPLMKLRTYDNELEITDYVLENGVKNVSRNIDSGDYDFGVFSFGDINLKCVNINGYFNDESDSRSIFKFSRDRAKIRIEYIDDDGTDIVFKGIINEEGTRSDPVNDEIDFKVLSLDSVLRTTAVSGGSISSTSTVKQALGAVLNRPDITAFLNYNAADINPDYNFVIDDGSFFDNISTKEALDILMNYSNSVFLIDADENMIVRNRDRDTDKQIVKLYGPYSLLNDQNILKISNYNTGKHRQFTSVRVNDVVVQDIGYLSDYGFRQKKYEAQFITNPITEAEIATRLVDEFKASKIELSVEAPTKILRGVELLDTVTLDFPLRIKPIEDKFLPVIGVTKIGDETDPLPKTFGSLFIDKDIGFKVLEIIENPKDFITSLKLRQIGTSVSDGTLRDPESSLIGYGRIGFARIAAGTSDTWNPSVLGAGLIGQTKIG